MSLYPSNDMLNHCLDAEIPILRARSAAARKEVLCSAFEGFTIGSQREQD
jgi:hypothetical protein